MNGPETASGADPHPDVMPEERRQNARRDEDDQPERVTLGASATLSNVGPEHRGIPETEELDAVEGTTSNRQRRLPKSGKPERGSRDFSDL